jgi:hypothetical protein
MRQSRERLKDFVRAAFHLEETARYVINGETFARVELVAALKEFDIANKALTDADLKGH